MTAILALVLLDVLLVQTLLQGQEGWLGACLPAALLSQGFQAQAEIEERFGRVCDALAVLTRRGALQLAVEGVVDYATARVLPSVFLLLVVTIPLVELLGQELEKLVGVLFLCCDQIFKCLLVGNPETGEHVGCRVTVRLLDAVKLLEYVIHGTTDAMLV